jgi:hypothetical protein
MRPDFGRLFAIGLALAIALASGVWLKRTSSVVTEGQFVSPVERSDGAGVRGAGVDATTDAENRARDAIGGRVEERDQKGDGWLARYTHSDDFYGFIEEALDPALSGDPRAQYFVGQAISECRTIVAMVNQPGKDSFAANVDETLASLHLDGALRDRFIQRITRCERFFAGSPMANLPDEQQESRYWLQAALAGGDAFALLDRALSRSLADRSPLAVGNDHERRSAVIADLREALTTRDAAVMFRVGGFFSNPTVAQDASLQGPAWIMAACSAGYDCSSDNPDIGFGCAQFGTCNAGFTIPDVLQRDLPPREHAAAFAASQDILYRIEAGDWDGLEKYLEVRL